MEFREKFIAFVDILGWKGFVKTAEAGTGITLDELLELLDAFGTCDERLKFETHGPICCPKSFYTQRNLDFRLTRVSDCMIVSAEISPAGLINLVHHCWTAAMILLDKGFLCRGYITRGKIYHTNEHLIGSGYHRVLDNEKGVSVFRSQADETGTPFIEVDNIVSQYVEQSQDKCVKEMYSRFVKCDGEAAALFPFQLLSHSFLGGGFERFNAERERQANQNVRLRISKLKAEVMAYINRSDPRAVQKAEHYINALEAQLDVCDETEDFIAALDSPILGRSIREEFEC
jgi:hypothetical protein